MTEREFIETYYELLNFINSNFQIWLSATFALTMAFHFAGRHITTPLKRYLLSLYAFTSLILLARFVNAGIALNPLRQRATAEYAEINLASVVSPDLIGPLIIVVMVTGSVGAIYYANESAKNGSNEAGS